MIRNQVKSEYKSKEDFSYTGLLCTSWSHQVKEFSEKSSLHGIRYVAQTDRPFCERFMWFCFVMAGVALVTINVVSLWDKFQTNPTITGLDMDFHNWDVPFPAITLCPANSVNSSYVAEYIHDLNITEYSNQNGNSHKSQWKQDLEFTGTNWQVCLLTSQDGGHAFSGYTINHNSASCRRSAEDCRRCSLSDLAARSKAIELGIQHVNYANPSVNLQRRWGNVSEEVEVVYADFLTHLGNLSYENLASFAKYKNDRVLPQDNLREILNNVVLRCEDLIASDCSYKDEPYQCCERFFPVLTENGFCYSFNSERIDFKSWPWLKDVTDVQTECIFETDSNLQLAFNVLDTHWTSMKIYIHNNNEIPEAKFFPQHVWTGQKRSILFSAKHTYTMDDVRQLTIRQRHCVFEDEIQLVTDEVYTFGACVAECRMRFAMSVCNCVPHFYKETTDFPHCTLQGLSCLADYAGKFQTDLDCGCELGCTNTVYEVEKIDGEEKQDQSFSQPDLVIGFLSWPTVRYKREVLFGWVDLLVAFGGIAGLFLGFSLLSGIEIIYYFTLRAFCMLHSNKKRVTQLHRRARWEKEERLVNLDLEPFIFGRKHPKLGRVNLLFPNSGNRWSPSIKLALKRGVEEESSQGSTPSNLTNRRSFIKPAWTVTKSESQTTDRRGRATSTAQDFQDFDIPLPYLP